MNHLVLSFLCFTQKKLFIYFHQEIVTPLFLALSTSLSLKASYFQLTLAKNGFNLEGSISVTEFFNQVALLIYNFNISSKWLFLAANTINCDQIRIPASQVGSLWI